MIQPTPSTAIRPGTLMRWYRMKPLLTKLTPHPKMVVIDVGSFDGLIGGFLVQQRGAYYCGIDIDRNGITTINNQLDGACASGLEAPFPNAAADIVLLLDVIEHVEDHAALLRECRRILRPDGLLLLSTPIWGVALVPWADMHDVHQRWDHQYREGYTYEQISTLLLDAGFVIDQYTTGFNRLSRWAYYLQFIMPGLRRFLANMQLFQRIAKLEPYLVGSGLSHVFVVRNPTSAHNRGA